jgi:cobalt-zinc-cadmium efflux system membrane fusion protein
MAACKKDSAAGDGAPPPPQVVKTGNASLVTVDKPDQFALVAAGKMEAAVQLKVTGSVFPDIAREIPVISLVNGRVVDIKARLDDYVKKGDLLIKVQSPDVAGAFDTYLKAANDEHMANLAYVRAQTLFEHGAISQSMLEQAEDTEKDAQADLTAAEEGLKILGVDKKHPSSVVNVYSPISGVIVAQNVTQAAAAGVNLSGSATAFTIADLSTVWIICDVYEKRHSQDSTRSGRANSYQRLSRQGADRPRQRHRAGAGSHDPYRQSPHRDRESRHSPAGHVRHRDF